MVAAPTVTGLSPTTGPAAGGTLVTITGTGFTGATAVDFGTTAATNVTVVSDTTITADSPAGTGVVNVTVTTPAGTSAVSPADEFTYTVAAAPVVTGLSPTTGPTAGGTLVTITGTEFHRRHGGRLRDDGGDECDGGERHHDHGGQPGRHRHGGRDRDDACGHVGHIGRRSVHIHSRAPAVTGLSPTSGPPAGGTMVTITGTGFTGATAVDFGTTAATNVDVVSDTTITADSPAGTGTVDVTVTTPGGTSPVTQAGTFTYVVAAAPVVTGLSPTSGPAAGGTLVTITGTSFTGATAVDFGTTPATNLTVVSDTSITVDSPAGAGTVDVTVTTPGAHRPRRRRISSRIRRWQRQWSRASPRRPVLRPAALW